VACAHSLGPPFLDEETVVDSNATTGFAQASRVSPGEDNVQLPVPGKDREYFTFPRTTNPAGTATQTRTMEGAQADDVASYIIPDGASNGWCTATSPKDGMVIGYVWPVEDYPWLTLCPLRQQMTPKNYFPPVKLAAWLPSCSGSSDGISVCIPRSRYRSAVDGKIAARGAHHFPTPVAH
jgi:hypothetical protein